MNSKIVMKFINAINKHDVDLLASLMAGDHVFIDAHGNKMNGIETMKKGWIGYFNMFPDYNIEVTDIFENGNSFGLFGFTSGTYMGRNPEKNFCRLPAAWKAVIEGDKVKHWQVYADTKIPYDIIGADKVR